ncbi:hypothetical protein SLS61_004784 [Didymella pomorum]
MQSTDLMDQLRLIVQLPPADFVPDPKYAHIKLGRREPDESGGGSQKVEEEAPKGQEENVDKE